MRRGRRGRGDTPGGGARGAAARARAGLTQTRVCAGARGGRAALTQGRKLRPAGPQHLVRPRRTPPAPRRVPGEGEGQRRGSPDAPGVPAVPAPPARSPPCARGAAAGCGAPEGGRRLWAGTRRGGKGAGGEALAVQRRRAALCRGPAPPPHCGPRPSFAPPGGQCGAGPGRRRPAPSRCVSASVRRGHVLFCSLVGALGARCVTYGETPAGAGSSSSGGPGARAASPVLEPGRTPGGRRQHPLLRGDSGGSSAAPGTVLFCEGITLFYLLPSILPFFFLF